ncbi:hypothetical protein SMICM17S_10402 [Streptomyces microflavus]
MIASSATAPNDIRRVRPTSRVTDERDSSTVTFSPPSPVSVARRTEPVGRSPTEMGLRPGISISAYRAGSICSASTRRS